MTANNHHVYVGDAAALEELLEQVRTASKITVDIEADSLHHYYEKVCLIQLSLSGINYIVDPLASMDMAPLLAALAPKSLVFHDAGYDLRMLRRHLMFQPAGEIFDTLLAAQLLGYEQLGLAALVERHFGIHLPKAGKKYDWSKRPLSPTMLVYAGNDTLYLEELAQRMSQELHARGRSEWLRQSVAALVRATAADKPRDEREPWRIGGLKDLTGRELAFVREIWQWREDEARHADVPPFKIIGNHQIIDLACHAARPENLPFPGKLPRHIHSRRLAALHQAIARAQQLPGSDWPAQLSRAPQPPGHPAYHAFRAACNRLAEELALAPAVLASRAVLEAILKIRPHTLEEALACGLMLWQAELILPLLPDALP